MSRPAILWRRSFATACISLPVQGAGVKEMFGHRSQDPCNATLSAGAVWRSRPGPLSRQKLTTPQIPLPDNTSRTHRQNAHRIRAHFFTNLSAPVRQCCLDLIKLQPRVRRLYWPCGRSQCLLFHVYVCTSEFASERAANERREQRQGSKSFDSSKTGSLKCDIA